MPGSDKNESKDKTSAKLGKNKPQPPKNATLPAPDYLFLVDDNGNPIKIHFGGEAGHGDIKSQKGSLPDGRPAIHERLKTME